MRVSLVFCFTCLIAIALGGREFSVVTGADAQAQSMTKSQKRNYEKRMAQLAQKARTRQSLEATSSYQEATDCTISLMEAGMDYSKQSSLSQIQEYASEVATWQTVRSNKAKVEGVGVADLKKENYCDLITGGCGDHLDLSEVIRSCRVKLNQAEKNANKAEKR